MASAISLGRQDVARLLAALAVGAGCAGSGASAGRALECVSVAVTPKMAMAPAVLTATATVTDGAPWQIQWFVTRAGLSVPFHLVGGDSSVIEVDAAAGGTYHFVATATRRDLTCTSTDDAVVTGAGRSASYRLRVTPPPGSGLPKQDRTVVIHHDTPLDHQLFTLEAGLPVAATLLGPMGGIGGTVRFVSENGLDVLAASGADGSFTSLLLAAERYRVVLIPNDSTLAPSAPLHDLGAVVAAGPFAVDAGVIVSGTVKDEAGAPIAGARVVLSDGSLPSGVGITDGKGAFALHAAPGMYAATVEAAAHPDVRGPVTNFGKPGTLEVAYQKGLFAIGGTVLGSDGKTPVVGARVSVRSTGPALSGVATIGFSGGAPVPAEGLVRIEATSGAMGVLPSLVLPASNYEVLIEPPAGPVDGVTQLHLAVAGADHWKLGLQPRTRVSGTVSDGSAAIPGVRVVAAELGGSTAAPAAVSDGNGAYHLDIDSGVGADLYFDAPLFSDPKRHFQRAHLALAPGAAAGDVKLTQGLLLRGTIAPPAGAPIAGALVEAWCLGCPDTWPAGMASTDGDGSFTMYLPDPGP